MFSTLRTALAVFLSAAAASACVPEGPSTADAGAATKPVPVVPLANPPPPSPSASPAASSSVAVPSGPPITSVFEDKFDRVELGADWNAVVPKWKIEGGRLCGRSAHNHGVWLVRK